MKIFLGIAAVCGAGGIPIVPQPQPIDILLSGLAAEGCACGYSYCPSLDTCVKPGETYCQELDFPYNALYKGSGIILPPNKKSTSINNAV